MFAMQLEVVDRAVYPGKAKNSIDTLSSAVSTVDALEGAVDGTGITKALLLPVVAAKAIPASS